MPTRLDNLQALRGVACLLVVVYHVAGQESLFGLGFRVLRPVHWFGYSGVDLFFVLSGFIIATTSLADLGRPDRVGRFVFRRLWRIYPTYWAVLVVTAGVFAALTPDPFVGPRRVWELFDTVLLLPQVPIPRVIPMAWSLSYELMFYAAFATLFFVPRRLAGPALLIWAALVVGATLSGYVPQNRFAALPLSGYVLEFLLGAMLAWWQPRLTLGQSAAALALGFVWLGVGSAAFFHPDPHRLTNDVPIRVLVFGPPAALIVFALAGRERAVGGLGWRWLEAVGDASYSIYLAHGATLMVTLYLSVLVGWSHRKVWHLGWVGFSFVAAVATGLLFHRWVERPLLHLAKRPRPEQVRPTAGEVPVRLAA